MSQWIDPRGGVGQSVADESDGVSTLISTDNGESFATDGSPLEHAIESSEVTKADDGASSVGLPSGCDGEPKDHGGHIGADLQEAVKEPRKWSGRVDSVALDRECDAALASVCDPEGELNVTVEPVSATSEAGSCEIHENEFAEIMLPESGGGGSMYYQRSDECCVFRIATRTFDRLDELQLSAEGRDETRVPMPGFANRWLLYRPACSETYTYKVVTKGGMEVPCRWEADADGSTLDLADMGGMEWLEAMSRDQIMQIDTQPLGALTGRNHERFLVFIKKIDPKSAAKPMSTQELVSACGNAPKKAKVEEDHCSSTKDSSAGSEAFGDSGDGEEEKSESGNDRCPSRSVSGSHASEVSACDGDEEKESANNEPMVDADEWSDPDKTLPLVVSDNSK